MNKTVTTAEKLAEIERLIEIYRWARSGSANTLEPRTYHVLKSYAVDLRARLDGTAEEARRELGRRVAAIVRASDGPDGGFARAAASAGRELTSRWPVVEHALEQYEKSHVSVA